MCLDTVQLPSVSALLHSHKPKDKGTHWAVVCLQGKLEATAICYFTVKVAYRPGIAGEHANFTLSNLKGKKALRVSE